MTKSKAMKMSAAIILVTGLSLGTALSAQALPGGTRACSSGRTLVTYSSSGSGLIVHYQTPTSTYVEYHKSWTNSGTGNTSRNWDAGFGSTVDYSFQSDSLASYSSTCEA